MFPQLAEMAQTLFNKLDMLIAAQQQTNKKLDYLALQAEITSGELIKRRTDA